MFAPFIMQEDAIYQQIRWLHKYTHVAKIMKQHDLFCDESSSKLCKNTKKLVYI